MYFAGNNYFVDHHIAFKTNSSFNWAHSIHTGLMNASHSIYLFTNSCHRISTNGKAPPHSQINQQHPKISLFARAKGLTLETFAFWWHCGLWFLFYSAFGFRFSAKIKTSFRTWHSMRFGVVPVSLRQICVSTTSTSCTSSLILLAVFGFDRNSMQFCDFYYYLNAFVVSYLSQCPL